MTVDTLATQCATDAFNAGGPNPFDSEGQCILPSEPQDADWEYLTSELGRKPTAAEELEFGDVYHNHIARLAVQTFGKDKLEGWAE